MYALDDIDLAGGVYVDPRLECLDPALGLNRGGIVESFRQEVEVCEGQAL